MFNTCTPTHISLCVFVYIRRLLDIPQGDSCNVRGLMWLVSVLIITISPTVPLGPCSPAPLLHHSARVNTLRSHFCFTLVTFATDELFVEIYFAPHRLNQILFTFVLFYREMVFF